MEFSPSLKQTPLTALRKIGGLSTSSLERRERRVVAEAHGGVKEIAEFLSGFRPARFVGTDGNTYETESKRVVGSAAGRVPWLIVLSGNSINISIPLCSFQVIGGTQPPVKVNGTDVDYADPTKNILPLSSDLSLIALECEIDDTRPEAINTIQVNVVSISPDKANTATRRYIPIAIVQASTLSVSSPYLPPKAITTARRGDRDSTSNMVWF